jgi:prevent-host-death family protein
MAGYVRPMTLTEHVVVQQRTEMYDSCMATITASEARSALPELLSRVGDGEEITITRHGRPVAVLVRPDRLRSRRSESVIRDAERLDALLTEARTRPLSTVPGITDERLEELVREVRESRDSR